MHKNGTFQSKYIETDKQAADIFTKFYTKIKKDLWRSMCDIIGVYDGSSYESQWGNQAGDA